MNTFKLNDDVIASIAKTLQLAILTGTDIVDNLRTIEVQDNGDGTLSCTPNYNSNFEHWVAKMLTELEEASNQEQPEESEVKGLFE